MPGGELAPVFVLDDALLRRHREAHPRLRFLDACLHDLAHALDATGSPPVVLRGTPHRSLPAFARACKASLVTWNRDYSPYAKRRDRAVRRALERDRIEVREQKDRVVFEGEEIRTGKGEAYTVYTPYRRAWWRRCRTEPPEGIHAPARPSPYVDVGSLPGAPFDDPPGAPLGDSAARPAAGSDNVSGGAAAARAATTLAVGRGYCRSRTRVSLP